MGLPINIHDLIHGRTVEWERLEFKEGWNPEDVIHSMCAFANDLNNWGGGYIIIGVADNNGQPVLPPAGLQQNQLDAIQKKIIELGNRISPAYFPITQPYEIDGKHILVLWCPAGDNRPYDAPESLAKGAQRFSYVRITSNSVIARGENLRKLQALAARIPFDDRVNNQASLKDFDLGLIQAHLYEIKSSLYEESKKIPFEDLCRTMFIAKGPQEDLRPVNVGLLFFSKTPEQFFSRAWIELVWHKDKSGKKFEEVYFKGPVQKHLRDALSFIQTIIIKEKVVKHKDRAEADRFFNYPYEAIEEALSNAVYHKSYELGSPIEVQIFPDKITILSHPGPVPPVNAKILATQRQIIAREYRNRRIGDFLKELHLTEGRGTGFPIIYDAMSDNGSPKPVFETDDEHYVLVTLPVHPLAKDQVKDQVSDQVGNQVNGLIINSLDELVAFCDQAGDQVSDQVSDQAQAIVNDRIHARVSEILQATKDWIKRAELFPSIGLSNHSKNREKYLDPIIDLGWIEMEYPDKRTSPKQRYKITASGQNLLNLIKGE